jgi:hypothetical protein
MRNRRRGSVFTDSCTHLTKYKDGFDCIGPECEVESILAHRCRGRGYQFISLLKGDPIHNVEWQPARDFIDPDETMTEALMKYVQEQNFNLALTRMSMKGGGNSVTVSA